MTVVIINKRKHCLRDLDIFFHSAVRNFLRSAGKTGGEIRRLYVSKGDCQVRDSRHWSA